MQEIRPGDAKLDFLGVIPHGSTTSNFLVSRGEGRFALKNKGISLSKTSALLSALSAPCQQPRSDQTIVHPSCRVARRNRNHEHKATIPQHLYTAHSHPQILCSTEHIIGALRNISIYIRDTCLPESVTRSPSKVPAKYMPRRSPYTVDCDWSARVPRLHVQTSLAPPTQGGQDS